MHLTPGISGQSGKASQSRSALSTSSRSTSSSSIKSATGTSNSPAHWWPDGITRADGMQGLTGKSRRRVRSSSLRHLWANGCGSVRADRHNRVLDMGHGTLGSGGCGRFPALRRICVWARNFCNTVMGNGFFTRVGHRHFQAIWG